MDPVQFGADHADKPWQSLSGATDHDGVGARLFQSGAGLLHIGDIAIDDQRNADRISHRPDGGPVRLALVELLARAAVNRDQLNAGRFCTSGQFRRIYAVMIPA